MIRANHSNNCCLHLPIALTQAIIVTNTEWPFAIGYNKLLQHELLLFDTIFLNIPIY